MHIDDFLLNFRQTYKSGKTDDNSKDQNEETLRREFTHYPPDKLEKVWQAVRRHHKATWYPIIGQVLECMEKAGLNESSKFSKNETAYNRCVQCGTNYSLKARNCPTCNKPLTEGYIMNEVEIVMSDRFEPNHISCNETCPICPTFKKNKNIRGAKCRAWGKSEEEKIGFNCEGCPCYACCNERGEHDEEHQTGGFMYWVSLAAKSDPYWIKFYESLGVTKGMNYKYAGNYYKNKTGEYLGQSPQKDGINWESIFNKQKI